MTARTHILSLLRKQGPVDFGEVDIWDLQPAARGLTVILQSGRCIPCPCSYAQARQFLHLWSVQETER